MPDIETVYAEGVALALTPFTIRLIFTAPLPPGAVNQPATTISDVALSPQHAKVLAIVLKRNLKAFEEQTGQVIAIHPQVAAQLGISPHEDW